ncbi:LOW QUALITY PROTEIN: armadillo-like helical domain-containing protein 4 [Acomys russatus]|uniref:LOW QUALITY PROTEIN: armadillo-like helical domain-containing protein 4 n=1 Tax=Acomys russatus TaxID=60746 RepID=UPI0021E2215A|nr:LOW QUALITY PROTEIN: armadillo-like helical domain-containing protein 4 [Acomys russatus]
MCFASLQDSVTALVTSFNSSFSSMMSRPALLHTCMAFFSFLLLTLATECLAFPKVERREVTQAYEEKEQSRKMSTDDKENVSFAAKSMPQQMFSDTPMVLSAGPTVTPLSKIFSVSEKTHLPGAGLLHPTSPDLLSSSEPVASASEQEHGPSQLKRVSPEQGLYKATLPIAASSPASLSPDQEGAYSNSSTQPLVDRITDGAHSFLRYVDSQLFSTESQEAASLENSPSSYIETKEMPSTNPRTEQVRADAAKSRTAFPGIDSTKDTEPDGERTSHMPADDAQSTPTIHLVATYQNVFNIESTADSLPGYPKGTVSVSRAAPVFSDLSNEWDDTKFESVSQMRPPEPGDNAETRVRTEPPYRTFVSFEGTERSPTSMEVTKIAAELPGGETPLATASMIALEGERSPVFIHQIPFTPMRLTEDSEVSTVNLFPGTGGFIASTQEDRTMFSPETAVSASQYQSEAQQAAGNVLTDKRKM